MAVDSSTEQSQVREPRRRLPNAGGIAGRGLSGCVTLLRYLAIAVPAVAVLARNSASGQHWIVIAAAGAPVITLFGLLLALGLAVARRFVLAGVLTLLMLLLVIPQLSSIGWSRPAAGSSRLSVITLNMRLGQADAGAVVGLVMSRRPNVLALQEMTPQALDHLQRAGIDRYFGYHYLDPVEQASGIGIFSTFALSHTTYEMGFGNHVLSAKLQLPNRAPITVLSSHLVAPWPQPAAQWRTELGRLSALLASAQGCLIDAGDFNATTDHRDFRQLLHRARVADAASQSGAMTVRTYPADSHVPPLLAIDHVLLRGLAAHAVSTVHIPGSDHRAVVAELNADGC